jgi:hypothetical protein
MTVESFWQFTKADGDPAWPTGAQTFALMWARAEDLLRFHKGAQFTIENRKSGDVSKPIKLVDVDEPLKNDLQAHPDVTFVVRSGKDQFALAFRRHTEELKTLGAKFLDVGRELMGAPYDLGGTTSAGIDCSGLVIRESTPFGITYGEHRAYVMWQEFRQNANGKFTIPRAKILKGDLIVFHGGAHIATYIDDTDGGRVLDAEPHSVQSPWGWTPAGVQVRSMAPRYYCEWAAVEDVCRLSAINGQP